MIKRGLIAGVVLLIVGMGFNWLVTMLVPSLMMEYQSGLFRPWDDPVMMLFLAYPFILGFVLAVLWDKLKKPSSMEFAKLYFLIATLPGMFVTYTSFYVSVPMVLMWAASGVLQAYVAAEVYGRVKK